MTELRKISRREFLRRTGLAGGGLILGLSILRTRELEESFARDGVAFEPNVFISIGSDGRVTLVVSRSEMGQGTRTGMPMILAEELDVGLDQIRIVQADGDEKYGHQLTGGSLSVRLMWDPLRQAGASARAMLVAAAAGNWGVPVAECETDRATVRHGPSGRSAVYADLVGLAAQQAVPDPDALALKSPEEYELLGTAVPRLDTPDIVTGRASFGMDTRRPNMRVAAIARCPFYGGRLVSYDEQAALAIPGVQQLIELPALDSPVSVAPGVAVLADDTWSAFRGVQALDMSWDSGPHADESTESLRRRFEELAREAGEVVRNDGDAAGALAGAARIVGATYELPFLSHAPMEPMNCTVHVRGRNCEVWTPTQNPQQVRKDVATILGISESAVDVHVTLVGGGFGRRLSTDVEVQAALIAREVDAPVMVVWSREDDMRHDRYRPSSHHVLRGGLDAEGNLIAWHWNILNTAARRFDPNDFPAYHVPNYRVEYTHVPWILPRGPWRSTVNSQNPFVTQCFFDELAVAAGHDPLEWRLRLLKENPRPDGGRSSFESARMLRVIEEVADHADWSSRPAPGTGRGVSFFFGYGSYVAEVAELHLQDGEVRVDRVVCVLDCGQVVNPDLVLAQIEGAIAFGLSAALLQAITVRGGRVRERNFDEFPTLRATQMPRIEGHIIPSRARPGGVGETPLPPIAPAVANAVLDLSGRPIRRLPIASTD